LPYRRGDRRRPGIGDVAVFGSFTVGLFCSGFAAPTAGRLIDARGGRTVLAGGSAVCRRGARAAALARGTLSRWPASRWRAGNGQLPTTLRSLRCTGSRAALYRKAVTVLTLFGGFASTVFWPLSQYLLDTAGWRAAFGVFAALNLPDLPAGAPVDAAARARGTRACPFRTSAGTRLSPPIFARPCKPRLTGGVSIIGAFGTCHYR
jgi:hypothetical protein